MAELIRLDEMGNLLIALFDDGSNAIAYPVAGGGWIVSEGSGGGPGPDPEPSGEFAWTWNPTPQDEGGDMPPNGSSDQPLAEFGPRNLTGSFHEGIDFGYGRAAAVGARNRATGDGTVVTAGTEGGWGLAVVIFHGTMDYDGAEKDIYTRHGHHDSLLVSVGDTVKLGDDLGVTGSTGNVTGKHDHYETHVCEPGTLPVNNIANPSAFRTAINPRDFHAVLGNGVI